MAKELPYFKFEPAEWMAGRIALEPYEVQGAYISICSLYWQKLSEITERDARLRIGGELLTKLIDKEFIEIDGDFITIKWLESQLSERKAVSEKRSKAGAKGGKANAKQAQANAKQKEAEENRREEKREEEVYKQHAHLSITLKEFNKLVEEYGSAKADEYVDKVLNYSLNHKYKSLYLTAKNWLKKDINTNNQSETEEEAYARKYKDSQSF